MRFWIMRTRRDRMALFGMGMLILAVLAAGYMQLYRLHDRLLLQEVMRMYTRIKENVNKTDTAGMIPIGGVSAGLIEAASAVLIQVNHFNLTLLCCKPKYIYTGFTNAMVFTGYGGDTQL
jgi:hypothetical protein